MSSLPCSSTTIFLAGRRLILGPQPADEAFGLLGPALLVELDQAGKDLLVGEIPRPAVGVEHRSVDLLVQMLDDRDEPALMDVLLLLGQRRAGPQLLQDVVEPGQREVLVRREHPLPMRVELLGEIADGLPAGPRWQPETGTGRSIAVLM